MSIVDKIRRRVKLYQGEHLVLSRVACLGHDLRDILYNDKRLLNQQKARADLFLAWMNGRHIPVASKIIPHLQRTDIANLIQEQEHLPWKLGKRSNGLVLIDSFAELTDQKFVHRKDGWWFAGNYTDFKHTEQFNEEFECHGLIEIKELEQLYVSFFGFINKHYNNKEILFLHFPTVLDNRIKFRERGEAIKDALQEVCKVHKNVRNIHIDDNLVLPHEDDDFPYHYAKSTYHSFAKIISNGIYC